jgi:hypothetical protein
MKMTTQLLKDLIDSDFLFLESTRKDDKLKEIYHLKKKKSGVLDIFELNKSLKQFIRNLQFLKKSDVYLLQIWVQDKFLQELLKTHVVDSSLKIKIIDLISTVSYTKEKNLFLSIGDLNLKGRNILDRKFTQNNVFIVTNINSTVNQKSLGHYKIYNNIKTLKKFTFLLSIINQVLKIN